MKHSVLLIILLITTFLVAEIDYDEYEKLKANQQWLKIIQKADNDLKDDSWNIFSLNYRARAKLNLEDYNGAISDADSTLAIANLVLDSADSLTAQVFNAFIHESLNLKLRVSVLMEDFEKASEVLNTMKSNKYIVAEGWYHFDLAWFHLKKNDSESAKDALSLSGSKGYVEAYKALKEIEELEASQND